jgi:hypothetical protein
MTTYETIKEKLIVPHGLVIEANGKRYTSGQRLPKDSVITYISDDKLAKTVGIRKPKPATTDTVTSSGGK